MDKLKLTVAVLLIIAGIAAFYYFEGQSILLRAGMVILSVLAALGMVLTSVPGQAAWEFAKGSRLEVRKVVWPTRRETVQGTLVVMVMVVLVGLYLWLLDISLFWVIYDLVLKARGV
jgi:preprotein translocase subunit SecE